MYVVFAHPSRASFTYRVLQAFLDGLRAAGRTYELGDLYAMGFQSELDASQYDRETSLDAERPVPPDVAEEHRRIDRADALVFVYPLWWSDCPAILKGWFDRVWSYGFAYRYLEDGTHAVPGIGVEKVLAICPAGNTTEDLEETGIAESMRKIMIGDRIQGVGIRDAELVLLGGQTKNDKHIRRTNLERSYQLGLKF